MEKDNENKGIKYFFDLSEVWGYYFRKKDLNGKPNSYIRMMHGINKIAIVMFLIGLIFMIYRYVFVY